MNILNNSTLSSPKLSPYLRSSEFQKEWSPLSGEYELTLNSDQNTPRNAQEDKPTKEKKEFVIDYNLKCLMIITLLINIAYGLIAPFLPKIIKSRDISTIVAGALFSIYSIAVIFWAPQVGYLLTFVKTRRIYQFGFLAMALSMATFAFSDEFSNNHLFLVFAFIARIMQGVASCSV